MACKGGVPPGKMALGCGSGLRRPGDGEVVGEPIGRGTPAQTVPDRAAGGHGCTINIMAIMGMTIQICMREIQSDVDEKNCLSVIACLAVPGSPVAVDRKYARRLPRVGNARQSCYHVAKS